MFEHFGVKDIWPSIKKHGILIMIFIFFLTLIFGFISLNKVKSFLNTTHDENCPLYAASASYYVQAELDDTEIKNSDSDFWKFLPDNYVSLMNTDVCANFIYEKISKVYSSDYLIKNSEVSSFVDRSNSKIIDIESVKKLYKVSREKNTMVINIYSLAYNEELSKIILKECCNFFEIYSNHQIKNSHANFIGETIKIIKSSSELNNDEDKSTKGESHNSNIKTIILIIVKNFVVPTIGLTACLLLIILFIYMFKPTLNSKSDFCEYNVPIIGEVKS